MKWLALIPMFGLIVAANACTEAHAVPPSGTHPTPIAITVDARGYHPGSVRAPAGQRARLVFTRISDDGCGQQLIFPTLGLRTDLPLNRPVEVDLTMPATGTVTFTCGMDMLRGSVVAQ